VLFLQQKISKKDESEQETTFWLFTIIWELFLFHWNLIKWKNLRVSHFLFCIHFHTWFNKNENNTSHKVWEEGRRRFTWLHTSKLICFLFARILVCLLIKYIFLSIRKHPSYTRKAKKLTKGWRMMIRGLPMDLIT
jgi:hypothetical protein